ncbi:thioesterase II family protein [Streptomyces sp. NPDC007856]|uniref:thioesterase II family protein n=1 Tax=Streptomyces sp. NPDC007856 TaxID=3364781 RepID=UPI0036A108D9
MTSTGTTDHGTGTCLRRRTAHPDPSVRLFCLPHAGSGALAYGEWRLPETLGVEIWAAQLPGREDRRAEQPLRRIEPMVSVLADAVQPLLDRPFAFFGHSMGALLAFEVTRTLRRRGAPAPAHLFLSGFRSPDLPPWRPAASTLDEEALLERLDEIAGPSRSAIRDRDLLLFLGPTIRADFEAVENYEYRHGDLLDVPMTCLGAVDDAEVRADEISQWWRLTNRACSVRLFEGGHLYLLDHRAEVLDLIGQELALLG